MRDRLATRRPLLAGLVLAVIASTVIGCGSTDGPQTSTSSSTPPATSSTAPSSVDSSSYPAGKEEICTARDNLKASIAALTTPAVLVGGGTAIEAALEQVQTDLGAIRTAAAADYSTEVDAVESALDGVRDAVGNLGDGGGTANIGAVTTAGSALASAADDLFTKLNTACGS